MERHPDGTLLSATVIARRKTAFFKQGVAPSQQRSSLFKNSLMPSRRSSEVPADAPSWGGIDANLGNGDPSQSPIRHGVDFFKKLERS